MRSVVMAHEMVPLSGTLVAEAGFAEIGINRLATAEMRHKMHRASGLSLEAKAYARWMANHAKA